MRIALLLATLAVGCAHGAARAPNISTAAGAATLKAPSPAEFVFGPGDRMSIRVWRHTEMDMEVTVAPDGGITYPLVGRIQVAGMSYPALVAALEEGLSTYYTDVSVAVNVEEVSNQKVFVLGEVRTPAVLQVQNDLSILEALARTGGIDPDARTDNVLLIRGGLEKPELFTVNVKAIYADGDLSQLVYLQRGDIVVVPTKTIADVETFFRRIQGVLAPFVGGSAIYRNAISGGAQGTSSAMGD
ncbi:MAG: polysaccharide biosynthesis/export family protein [Pseudomonadota bacterium]